MDNEENDEFKIKLKKPVSFADIAKKLDGILEVDTDNISSLDPNLDDFDYNTPELNEYYNHIVVDFVDHKEPFEVLDEKMINILPDGKIKKQIIIEGKGDLPQQYSTVVIDYNAYYEFNPLPFDSTYLRNKPHKFIICYGEVLPGLDIAVQTMKLYEKSRFLIDPIYAYGNTILGRIPSNARVLFEIKLINIIDSGYIIKYNLLSEEEKYVFHHVYKYSLALCEKGKSIFKTNVKSAIKNFNMADAALTNDTTYTNSEEQSMFYQLKLRIATNLIICYTKTEKYRKGIVIAEKNIDFFKDTVFNISAKFYFNYAKCLRKLQDFTKAKKYLNIALNIEHNNVEIAKEFDELLNDMNAYEITEEKLAKALMKTVTI